MVLFVRWTISLYTANQWENTISIWKQLQEANLTLNEEKCEFSKPPVEFLGTLIDSEGVHVSPKKVEAILKMKTPQDQTELRRFLCMVNQLSKFRPQIAELSKPLRDLLSSKSHWLWSDAQQQAFTALGRVVRKPVNVNPGLNVNCTIIFSCLKMFLTSNGWYILR